MGAPFFCAQPQIDRMENTQLPHLGYSNEVYLIVKATYTEKGQANTTLVNIENKDMGKRDCNKRNEGREKREKKRKKKKIGKRKIGGIE